MIFQRLSCFFQSQRSTFSNTKLPNFILPGMGKHKPSDRIRQIQSKNAAVWRRASSCNSSLIKILYVFFLCVCVLLLLLFFFVFFLGGGGGGAIACSPRLHKSNICNETPFTLRYLKIAVDDATHL